MQKLVTEGVKLMGELGFVPQQQILQGEQKRLAREKYKVAVIGQFKVGKSTLINKVFLRDNVLFTDLTEATAFPTEIEFGRPARLEVFPSTYAGLPSAQKTDSSAPLPAGEGSPHVIEEPNPEQIKAHTSADGDEARAQMARQTSRVRLLWPADSLKGLTVVDTPGINTPNEAVASTTYRVIPDADVAVFLTRAQQLSQTDIAFLRSRVFEQGISRCLAVVNYDLAHQDLSETALKNLVAAIEAQLAGIGRAHVPVVRLNMRSKPSRRNLGGEHRLRPNRQNRSGREGFPGRLRADAPGVHPHQRSARTDGPRPDAPAPGVGEGQARMPGGVELAAEDRGGKGGDQTED